MWCSYLFIYQFFLFFFLILSREFLLGSDTDFFPFLLKYPNKQVTIARCAILNLL